MVENGSDNNCFPISGFDLSAAVILSGAGRFAKRIVLRSRRTPTLSAMLDRLRDPTAPIFWHRRYLRCRGPSTPPFHSLRERNGCAQDDSLLRVRSPESVIQGNHSHAKSSQCGLSDSISAIFFARLQPLSCFS